MKKWISTLTVSSLFTLSAPLQAAADTLIFNTEPYAPFNYETDGKVDGPTYTILKQTCENTGMSCDFKILPWRRAYKNAQDGKINGLFSIGKRPDREEWMHYSQPILESGYGFFVNQQNPNDISDISSLTSYNVLTYGPSNTSKVLEKIAAEHAGLKMGIEVKPETPFQKLNGKRFTSGYDANNTAILFNRDVGNALIKTNKYDNLRFAGMYKSSFYYLGMPKKSTTLATANKFNAGIKALLSDKAYADKISNEFGVVVVPTEM